MEMLCLTDGGEEKDDKDFLWIDKQGYKECNSGLIRTPIALRT